MKTVIIFFLLTITLFAKAKDSCYTVQLLSERYSQKSFNALHLREFPSSCRAMHISSSLTVRCGCFENSKEVKKLLVEFQKDYSKAYIATTYKYRFEGLKASPSPKVELFTLDDAELKSYFELFISEQEFEYAKEIAKLGYSSKPNSIYWNKKLLGLSFYLDKTENSSKYIDFLYEKEYKQHYLALKKSTKEDRVISQKKSLNLVYMRKEDKEVYLSMFWRLSSLYEDKEYTSEFLDMPKKNIKYSYKDAKLLAYDYFKNYKVKLGYKALLFSDTEDADKEFYKLLSDFTWYIKQDTL